MLRSVVAIALCVALVNPAGADDEVAIPNHTIDRRVTGGISGVVIGLGLVSQLIPIRSHSLWNAELSDIDEPVHDQFSRRAAPLSDGLLGLSLAAPAVYLVGSTIDDADGDRLVLYGQSIAVNTLLAGVMKRLVQRPRPYMYSKDPAVQRYAREEGDDGYLSFYSGHAAMSFGAATTGAYLLGANGTSKSLRALAWGGGFLVAASTANLRVRAGKHFYTDVIIGSAIGIAVGYVVPALHADGDPYTPSGEEIAAAAGGILGGLLLSSVIPLEKKQLRDGSSPGPVHGLHIAPMPVNGGMGFAIGGGM